NLFDVRTLLKFLSLFLKIAKEKVSWVAKLQRVELGNRQPDPGTGDGGDGSRFGDVNINALL
ncbi:644_t:CDS:1, partial [Paraglomus brasilianum]